MQFTIITDRPTDEDGPTGFSIVLGISGDNFVTADQDNQMVLTPIKDAELGAVYFDANERMAWADDLLKREPEEEPDDG